MLKTSLTALALLLAVGDPRAVAAQHFPSSEDLAAMIRARVETSRGVALVLGVIEADGSTDVVYYGDAGEGARPLGARSVFEIGSVTKAFTGILLAEAVVRGEVALEDRVARHLPDEVTVPSRNGRQITLLDLATHRSSLTRMPTNMAPTGDGSYPTYTIEMLYEYLSTHDLRRDIGTEYEYSNIAVALLGHVLERASGKTYEQLLRERILDPLGMKTTSTKVEGEVRKWMTVGHDQQGLPAPYRNWPHLPAMGALRSNVEDLLRFLAANLRTPTSQLERSMRFAHEVRNTVDGDTDIGLGWHLTKLGNQRIISHGGSTRGFRAFLGFDPDAGVGVVLLANAPTAANDLAFQLINPLIPSNDAPAAERAEIDVPETMLRAYVGEYELRPGFVIEVTVDDRGLFAKASGQRKFRVFPESPTKFFARVVDLQISFARDDAGAVNGLVLYQGGGIATARRRRIAGVPLAAAGPADSLPGRRASIDSGALGEKRPLRILTPEGYALSMSTRYPVMLVLDGGVSLHHASAVATSLARGGRAPRMIVVHTPPLAPDRRSGLSKFVTDELRPWVDGEYRTAALTVIVGDAETVALAPEAYGRITIDPDGSLRASFGGDRTAAEDSADPHVALRDGLAWLFEGWELAGIATLAAEVGGAGWAKIDAHFAELSERFGYRVVPDEDLADVAGLTHKRQGRWSDATREMERNARLHPGSARVFNHLGDLYRDLCRWEASIASYRKAYDMAREMKYPNVSSYAIELGRIESEIDAGKECKGPASDRAEAEVDTAVLASYAGEYRFSSRFSIVVTFEGDRLWIQPTGQKKSRIYAESDVGFYSRVVPVEFTFTRDEPNMATGMIMHRRGRDLPGRRVSD